MFTVIGTATVDLFVSNLTAMPCSEGDEFTVDSLVFHDDPLRTSLGGNGANSAYALARLGASVELVGGLGADHLGDWMAAQLADAGVGMGSVRRYAGKGTATTLILSDTQQNRAAFHHAEANNLVDRTAIDKALVRRSTVLLLTSYSIIPGLRPLGAVDLFQKARSVGTRTAVDIGPAIGEPARLAELRPLLPFTDFFICNEHELHICTGEADLATGMAAILEGCAECVVIKRGAEGRPFCSAMTESRQTCPALPSRFKPPLARATPSTPAFCWQFRKEKRLSRQRALPTPPQPSSSRHPIARWTPSRGKPSTACSTRRHPANRLLDCATLPGP